MSFTGKLITLDKVTVAAHGRDILKDISFTINRGEIWTIVGNSGAGKSALLDALVGNALIRSGALVAHVSKEENPGRSSAKFASLVKPHPNLKNRSGSSELYYQQRYNTQDVEDMLTVGEYLNKDIPRIATHPSWTYSEVIELLSLQDLEERALIKLSNGETKRLMIAAALLKNPLLLLMDNPFVGLDVETRSYLDQVLSTIAQRGMAVMLTSSLAETPSSATHILLLEKGRSKFAGEKDVFRVDFSRKEETENEIALPNLLNRQEKKYEWIVKMEGVTVRYGNEDILRDINWEIRQGERWALSGPNGSGKTTLLSLINGDHPQAYANDIILFDKKRGSGESIWDIKKNIGFVSPELHQYFPGDQTCVKVVESGFHDTPGLFRKSNPEQKNMSRIWLEFMKLGEKAEEYFYTLSYSDQRLCLLARALVKGPTLLILDEPCQGLDKAQQTFFKNIIERLCKESETTLIYVTHFKEELPSCIQKELRLN